MNQERRSQIVEMIRENRIVKNTELMDRFGISIETVRRDLQYLEEQGVLERVYGGAVNKTFVNTEPAYAKREQESFSEKRAIAAAAEKMIAPRAQAVGVCSDWTKYAVTSSPISPETSSVEPT